MGSNPTKATRINPIYEMIKLSDLILEKKDGNYKYGCVYLNFKFPYVRQIHNFINPDDIYEEEDDNTYGYEDNPHITILYGIDEKVPVSQVRQLIKFIYFPVFEIHNVSYFENEKCDVLKFDVEGGKFDKIHNRLKQLPHKESEYEYHPHMTICYLKKGTADKYVKKFEGLRFKIQPTRYTYSKADGTKINIAFSRHNEPKM